MAYSYLLRANDTRFLLAQIKNNNKGHQWDWKITLTFYIGLHYVNHYSELTEQPIKGNHKETLILLNPRIENKTESVIFSEDAYDAYLHLYHAAWDSRYKKYNDNPNAILARRAAYLKCEEQLLVIKDYIEKQQDYIDAKGSTLP
jgi:hypothetical protein